MKNSFKVQLAEAVKRRQETSKDVNRFPTPEELNRKKIENMILFNSRHGMYNSAQK